MKKLYNNTENRRAFFKEMYIKLEGKCMICGEPERLVIDHDHKSGQMRGLLCYSHNSGLGMFQDSPELLRSAADYISSFKPKQLLESTLNDKIALRLNELLQDKSFSSDRARARQVSDEFSYGYPAAQARISRLRKRLRLNSPDFSC